MSTREFLRQESKISEASKQAAKHQRSNKIRNIVRSFAVELWVWNNRQIHYYHQPPPI
jgi:hypothetical protein